MACRPKLSQTSQPPFIHIEFRGAKQFFLTLSNKKGTELESLLKGAWTAGAESHPRPAGSTASRRAGRSLVTSGNGLSFSCPEKPAEVFLKGFVDPKSVDKSRTQAPCRVAPP